jgi:stress-induced morphogen
MLVQGTALRTLTLCSAAFRPRVPIVRLASSFVGPRQMQIQDRLVDTFAPTHLEVINESHGRKEDESHFKVVVVSEQFDGKRLVARHRLVNDALLDEAGKLPFHSLSVASAKTPEEWGDDSAVPASPRCMGGDGSGLKR